MNQIMEALPQCVSRPVSASAQTSGTAAKPNCSENIFQNILEQQSAAFNLQTAVKIEAPVQNVEFPLLIQDPSELIDRQELAVALASDMFVAADPTQVLQSAAPELTAALAPPSFSQYSAVYEPAGARQPLLTQTEQPVSQPPAQLAQEQSILTSAPNTGQSSFAGMKDQAEQDTAAFAAISQPQQLFRDNIGVPIKVGDPPLLETNDANFEEKLAATINQSLKIGQTSVKITLSPESLGTVVVDVARDENGALHVALNTTNERAQSILTRHVSGLQALLADTEPAVVQVNVQRQEESQHFQQYSENGSEHHQNHRQNSRQKQQSDDFMQQMRLGLTAVYSEAS